MESHSLDLDRYVRVVKRRRRRAKALVDFERHDQDELGFKANDVINVSYVIAQLLRCVPWAQTYQL